VLVLQTVIHVIPLTHVAVVVTTPFVILQLALVGHPCALRIPHAVALLVMEVLVA
jgi:hypothetical protein